MKSGVLAFIFTLILCEFAYSQNKLRITYTGFGYIKKYEIFEGEVLNYKIKGSKKFLTSRIEAFHDSIIILETEDAIHLDQLKLIRIKKKNFHNKLFQKIFIRGAIGYPFLAVTNNAINGFTPLLTERAAIVSGSFLLAWAITRRLDVKRIRITRHKALKIISMDYQGLNKK